MSEGQRRQPARRGRKEQVPGRRARRQLAVSQDRALRSARRAGRGDDQRRRRAHLNGVRGRVSTFSATLGFLLDQPFKRQYRRSERGRSGRKVIGSDDGGNVKVGEVRTQLGVGETVVERRDDRARSSGPVEECDRQSPPRSQQRHAHRGPDPAGRETEGDTVGARVQVAPCPPQTAFYYRERIAVIGCVPTRRFGEEWGRRWDGRLAVH